MLVAEDELHIGPFLDFGAAAARSPEQSQLHRAGIDGIESVGQVADKQVGAGKPDLRVVHTEGSHPLQEQDGVGHRDLEVRLLQAVAKAGVEQLDFSDRVFRHWILLGPRIPQKIGQMHGRNLIFIISRRPAQTCRRHFLLSM